MFAGRPYGRKSRDMSESNSRRNRTRYDNRDGKGAGFLSLCPYRASVAVAMGGGDGQASLLARAHVNEAIVPPLDDLSELMKKDDLAPSEKSVGTIRANDTYLALAQGEFKGLVAVQARVELAPILVEGARVVHRQLVALLGLDVAFLRAKLYADALFVGCVCEVGGWERSGISIKWLRVRHAHAPAFVPEHFSCLPHPSTNQLCFTTTTTTPHLPLSPQGPGPRRRPAWQTRSGPQGRRRP